MNVALWILFGSLVGWLYCVVNDIKDRKEYVTAILVSVGAGVVAGELAFLALEEIPDTVNVYSVVIAACGSAFALLVLGILRRQNR